ncbi:MAG: S41 family peptidase [Chloroflexota bacterium]
MATRARAWLFGCLALLVVLVPVVAVSASQAPAPEHVSADVVSQMPYKEPGSAAAPLQAGAVTRQAYDLLLDNYVTPPPPGALLSATVGELVKRVAERRPGDLPTVSIAADASREDAYMTFSTWLDAVSVVLAPVMDRAGLDEMATKALATAVAEHHTRYLDPRQNAEHEAWRRGESKYEGIGARLRRPTTVVLEVFDGSPAAAAGVKIGDRIVAVDGVAVVSDSTENAINRLRGAPGTSVQVTVERRGEPAPLTLTLVRGEITLPFVKWSVLPRDDGRKIGYIQIRGFPEPSVDEKVGQALSELDGRGIDGLILDLRGNSGGRIDVGIKVVSRFLQDGIIFQQVDRSGRERKVSPVPGQYWQRSVPISVLVDGGTASMGEIVSSALQEAGAARIVGTTTAGSVAGARMYPLANGGALQITVLTITSGQGRVLNDAGVTPDVKIDLSDDDLVNGFDSQLESAVKALARPAAPMSLVPFVIPAPLERAA